MEDLQILKEIISSGGSLGTIALIVFFAFKEGWIKIGKREEKKIGNGSTPTNGTKVEPTPQWASTLMQYVNHDQTEKLNKLIMISENIVKGFEGIKTKHDEWEKYGVPTRCIDDKK